MKTDTVVAGENLDINEAKILKILQEKPRRIATFKDEFNLDQGTVYKKIAALEKRGLVKIGFERTSRVKAECFCFLPSQEEDVKAWQYGLVYLPLEKPKPKATLVSDTLPVERIVIEINNALQRTDLTECVALITELRQQCHQKKVGHIKKLRESVPKWVHHERLFEDADARRNLARLMRTALINEIEGNEILVAEKIIEAWLDSAIKTLLYDRGNGRSLALQFLENTDLKKSVEAIITLIERHPEDIKGNFKKEIHYALVGSRLGKTQASTVRKALIKLRSSSKDRVKSVAKCLQEQSRLYQV